MIRSLGSVEKLMCYLDADETTNFSLYFSTKYINDSDVFAKSLEHLRRRFEIIGCTIDLASFCFISCDTPAQLIVESLDVSEHCQYIGHNLQNHFNLPYEPLFRLLVLNDIDNQITTIGLVLHHACADGISAVRLCRELMCFLIDKKTVGCGQLAPPVESYFTNQINEHSMPRSCFEKAFSPTSCQTIYSIALSLIDLQSIADRNQCSLHTILSILLSYVLSEQLTANKICIQSPVNMRRYIEGVSDDDILYCASRVDYKLSLPIGDLRAEMVKMHQYYELNLSQTCCDNVLAIKDFVGFIERSGGDVLRMLQSNDMPTLFFSNIGRLSLDRIAEKLPVYNVGMLTNSNAFLPNKRSVLVNAASLSCSNTCMLNIHLPYQSSVNGQQLLDDLNRVIG